MYNKPNNAVPLRTIIGGLILLVPLIVASFSIHCVNTGELGIVTLFGKVTGEVCEAGINIVSPWKSVVRFNCRIQKHQWKTECFSADLQNVGVDVNMLYHLDKKDASKVYSTIGEKYFDQVVPRVTEILKQETAKYKAEELVENREVIRKALIKATCERLQGIVTVDDINLTNFNFSNEYEKAIEKKQVAQQDALRAKMELEKARVEAETAKTKAEGEAEALRVKSAAIKENRDIVLLNAIEKWDGKCPQTLAIGADGKLLFPLK